MLVFPLLQNASAQESKEQPNIAVECKNQKIKEEALQFFHAYLTKDTTKKELSSLIKRFYFQWSIKNISVDQDESSNSFQIRIEPGTTVIEYTVSGNSGLSKEDVIREMSQIQTLYQGDQLTEELQMKMKAYYDYRGYPNAEVKVESIPVNKDNGITKINLAVKENKACILQKIELDGSANDVWMKKIKKQMMWKKQPRCDQEKIQHQIVDLREKYNRRLYHQFDIENPQLVYDGEDKLKADLHASLVVGPRIVVQFYGNRYTFERDELLKKAIFLDQEKKFNKGFENTALAGLKDFYEKRGYPYASIEFRQKKESGQRKFIFDIDRGPVMRLTSVKFDGNKEIKDAKLLREFKLQAPIWTRKKYWVSSDLPFIINGLLAYYQSKGYLHANFFEPSADIKKEKHEVNLRLKLEEGEPSFFEELHVQNNVFISTKESENFFDVKPGDPIDPVKMREAAQKLESEYQKNGFKYVKVKLPEIETIQEGSNQYIIEVEEGPRIRVGDIIVQGNYTTHNYVISRELTFDSGDVLNPEKIRESRRRILRLGFFQSLSIEEKVRDDLKDVEDIVITVTERKKRSVVIRPGVSTDEGARLGGSFGYSNIAGTGRSTILSGRINHQFNDEAILEHRLVATYLEPKIFNFMDGKINLIRERSEEIQFDIARTSFIVGVEKSFSTWLRTSLQYELEFRDPFNVEPNVVLSELDETQARFGSMGSIVDFDFRDNILNAMKGTFHRIQFNYYNKFFFSDADFFQLYSRNSFYVPIYRRIRTVFSIRAGYSATSGQTKDDGIDQIPIEKRFRLGGNSSLRGFGRNCVGGLPSNVPENCSDAVLLQAPGGNSMINYLVDLMFPLSPSLDFVVFTDGGNAYLNNSDFDIFDIRTSAGFGIRYNTVVGPLRVDYGIKLDRRTGESFGEFHFAVGQF